MSFLAVSTFVEKELVHSLAEHFKKPVKKLNNLNANYLKIPKTSRAAPNALAGRVFETLAVQYMRTACTVSISKYKYSRRDSVPWRSDARPPKIWLLGPF